jgi:hypothetical protein
MLRFWFQFVVPIPVSITSSSFGFPVCSGFLPTQAESYIKSKRQEPAGISPLLDKDEFLHSDSQIKAEILNHQFQSVYTKEDTTTLPDKGNSTIKSMNVLMMTF